MKFKQNGYMFNDEIDPAKSLNEYAKTKKVNVKSFVVEKNGAKTIVLFNSKGNPIFESQRMEDIAVHIDMMKISETLTLD